MRASRRRGEKTENLPGSTGREQSGRDVDVPCAQNLKAEEATSKHSKTQEGISRSLG